MGPIQRIVTGAALAATLLGLTVAPRATASGTVRARTIDGHAISFVTSPVPAPSVQGPFAGAEVRALSDPSDPSSWGRLATVDDRSSGVFVSDAGTWWLASDAAGALVAVADRAAVDRIPLADRRIEEPSMAAVSCDSLNWTPVFASPTHLVEGSALRSFEVAFAYDEAYRQRYGAGWNATLLATISTIDALLTRDASIRLVAARIDEVPASLAADTTDDTLDRLQDHYVAEHGGQLAETVFLFSGREFTNAGGQVNCVGSAGRTRVSYGVASVSGGDYAFPGGLVLLPDPGIKIGAHELGHTLSAHHHYANCVEAAPYYEPMHTTDACTVLINDWGFIGLRYSSLERLSMAGWADAYDL